MTAAAEPFQFGGANREHGGAIARFKAYTHGPAHHDRSQAALKPGNPALAESRTLFPSRVHDPAGQAVLVSGHNNSKTGALVMKGPWKGFPIYTVTLEERATCPTSCHLLAECYGSAMPLAKRWRHGPAFIKALDQDLRRKAKQHPRGFALRVHVLGDFWSAEYAWSWLAWLESIPQIHVWGYTAHAPDSEIGGILAMGNDRWPERWAMRFSAAPETDASEMSATTIWRAPEGKRVAEGQVCPAQTGGTLACATCALCWSPSMRGERIVFLGHGRKTAKGPRAPKVSPAATPAAPPVPQEIVHRIEFGERTLALLGRLIEALAPAPRTPAARPVGSLAELRARLQQ